MTGLLHDNNIINELLDDVISDFIFIVKINQILPSVLVQQTEHNYKELRKYFARNNNPIK